MQDLIRAGLTFLKSLRIIGVQVVHIAITQLESRLILSAPLVCLIAHAFLVEAAVAGGEDLLAEEGLVPVTFEHVLHEQGIVRFYHLLALPAV